MQARLEDAMKDELPRVKECTLTECVHYERRYCKAATISVGENETPLCKTFSTEEIMVNKFSQPLGVVDCSVHKCLRNRDLKCKAYFILVRSRNGKAFCQSYVNRYK